MMGCDHLFSRVDLLLNYFFVTFRELGLSDHVINNRGIFDLVEPKRHF